MSKNKFDDVNSQVDFIQIEHEILDFWKKEKIFDQLRIKNKGNPTWSFLDGPITANNPMGVHHAWGRTLKDLYQRYNGMLGKELRYQNGFDCQGLWVEVEVEKELGFKSKRDVEQHGIEKFVNLCKDRVRKFSKIQTEQSKRLGYWMDWDNSYYTMSDENNYSIWSFLKKLFEQGKIYKGSDVVPWSGRSGTSYSQMEIIEGRKLVDLTLLHNVPLNIVVELGQTDLNVKDLLTLHVGSTIELNKLAGEPLEFIISDRIAAKGEVVVLNEKFALRLTDIIDPLVSEREQA